MVKKTSKGWLVDVRPTGVSGKRYRRLFKVKADAFRWESYIFINKQNNEEWEPKSKDARFLSDLIELWYDLHGVNLKDGFPRKRKLLLIAEGMGNPYARDVSSSAFASYRQARLIAGVTPNTVNHDHSYLRAVFNELIRLGSWHSDNPLSNIRKLKVDQSPLTYLISSQIEALLSELKKSRNKDVYFVSLICLATGARWSEAENLRYEHVRNLSVTFNLTKSGKNRTIPISADLEALILSGRSGGKLFCRCLSSFSGAVDRAGITLPKGQMSHVLRHTFASHFMINGGNILTLQNTLGHSTLAMTMRYAHFSPDHLEEVRRCNPLINSSIY